MDDSGLTEVLQSVDANVLYGGHVASTVDMMDRQVALLVDERFSRGLPADLVVAEHHQLHHGFKGLQITASAIADGTLFGADHEPAPGP